MNNNIQKETINDHWKFSLESDFKNAKEEYFRDSSWNTINLPHDWSIFFDFDHDSPAQNEGGLLNGGTAWYRKKIVLNNELKCKRIRIHFGGIYMNSTLFVNGQEVGTYPNGYTPFSYDITDFLHKDKEENTLAIRVENKQPNSRWYSGSGIYRDVHLSYTDETYIAEYGTYVTTPYLENEAGGDVTVDINTEIHSVDKTVKLQFHLLDTKYNKIESFNPTEEYKIKNKKFINNQLIIEKPQLWSIDHPKMYLLQTDVMIDDEVVNSSYERFGFRYMNWTVEDGFSLNGEFMKFKGVSMHHDQGALGAVANYSAFYRQMVIMKDMGINSIRSTHNPADDKLIEIAEDLGLLVIDEAFDTWYGGKKTYDYGQYFEEKATHPEAEKGQTWAEYDLKKMVHRGKNSPAIIMWSIGNEVSESDNGSEKAVETVKNLNKWVKEIDETRYTTMGQDVFRWAATGGHEKIADVIDAVGFNYAEDNYEAVRANHPNWLIYGAETSSATRSRGIYAFPDENRSHDSSPERKFQQSDYGNDHVAWGKTATDSWIVDRDNKGYAGQFVWTGFDYIGEPTPWHNQNQTPPKSSYFGIVDTAGFPKNDYFLYQSQWNNRQKDPMVHILPHWNWEDEKLLDYNMRTKDGKIPVRIYSNAYSIELKLNGQSLGIKEFKEKETDYGLTYQEGKNPTELYLEWRLKFIPGEIVAIGRNKEGQEIARDVMTTAQESSKILLAPESKVIDSDRYDLIYVQVSVLDDDNIMNPNAQSNIIFDIEGDGKIVGVDNGDPASNERYKAQHNGRWERKAFNGKALVIIQATSKEGKTTLSAQSKGLKSHSIDLYATQFAHKNVILGYNDISLTTDQNVVPDLPNELEAVRSNNTIESISVKWDEINKKQLNKKASFTIHGKTDSSDIKAKAHIQVRSIDKIINDYRTTEINTLPDLPNSVSLFYTDGTETEASVRWDTLALNKFKEEKIVEIKGTVEQFNERHEVSCFVTVLNQSNHIKKTEIDATQTTKLQSVSLGDLDIKLKENHSHYYVDLDYSKRHTNLQVKAEEGVHLTVIEATKENGYIARIIATTSSGASQKVYSVHYMIGEPKIGEVILELNSEQSTVDTAIDYSIKALFEDGKFLARDAYRVTFNINPVKGIVVTDEVLQLHEEGSYRVSATIEYFNQKVESNTITIKVNASKQEKTIKNLHPIQLTIGLNSIPELTDEVMADFDYGYSKQLEVEWDKQASDQYSEYGNFKIEGTVENTSMKAEAIISVVDILSVENFSTATLVNKYPTLPELAKVYKSDNSEEAVYIEWDSIDQSKVSEEGIVVLEGSLEGTDIKTNLSIRVSEDTLDGDNIAQFWTGSDLPAGMASYTNEEANSEDSVSCLNDTIVSYGDRPKNRWTNSSNKNRTSDWVGILFADAGTITQRYIDNMHSAFYTDEVTHLPESYKIEYYVPNTAPDLPQNYSAVSKEKKNPLNIEENWKEVTNLKPTSLKEKEFNSFSFDRIASYAIRIKMNAKSDKAVGITEVKVLDKMANLHNDFTAKLVVNNETAEEIDLFQKEEITLSEKEFQKVKVMTTNNASSTFIYDLVNEKTVKIMVQSEDEFKKLEKEINLIE